MSEIIYILLTLSLLLCNVQSAGPPTKTIRQTANGFVEGSEEISSMGQKYYAFRSVPYAEPPITGTDIYTQKIVDRRFKVCSINIFTFFILFNRFPTWRHQNHLHGHGIPIYKYRISKNLVWNRHNLFQPYNQLVKIVSIWQFMFQVFDFSLIFLYKFSQIKILDPTSLLL